MAELAYGSGAPDSRFAVLRRRMRDGIKWWAEHQAWPATEEIRIEPGKLRF